MKGEKFSHSAGSGLGPSTPRSRSIVKVFLIVGVACAAYMFFAFDLGHYLTLESLKAHKDALRDYADANRLRAVLVFILAYSAQTALSLPGAAVMTLAGGFLFGTIWGTLWVNIGATSGAVLAFLVARYLFRGIVECRLGARLEAIQRGFDKNAFNYLLSLRLIPIFPFFLVNLASGLTRIRLTTYTVATAVGIVPASIIYANAGSQLGKIESLRDIVSPEVLGAFALLGGLALVPAAYRAVRARGR